MYRYSDILRFQFFRTFYQFRSYLEFRFSFVPRDLSEIRTDGTFHVNLVLRVTTRLFGERFGERVSWIRLYRFRHFVNPSFSRFSRLYIYIYINIWWLTFDVEEGSTGDTGNFDRVLSCVLHFGIHDDELVAIFLVLELVFRRREQFLLGEKMKKEDGDRIGWYTYVYGLEEEKLTSFRKNHFGLQFGFEKFASNTTFLSLPSLAYWSTNGFRKLSGFCEINVG